jgi:hypothetical protein
MSDRLLTHHLILNSNNTPRQYVGGSSSKSSKNLSNGSVVDILNSSPSNSIIYTTSTSTNASKNSSDLLNDMDLVDVVKPRAHPHPSKISENLLGLSELSDLLDQKINSATTTTTTTSSSGGSKSVHETYDDEAYKIKNRRSLIEPVNALGSSTVKTASKLNYANSYSRFEVNLLKELIQLGIKKEKLEKALASTAYQSGTDAINWLISHSKDPLVNNDNVLSTRDFILVLCPVGKLANQIGTFFQQSKAKCNANEAHFTNLLPYMKLSPFFKVSSSLSLSFSLSLSLKLFYVFVSQRLPTAKCQICIKHLTSSLKCPIANFYKSS